MDLTILVNFSQIHQREIRLADLMILTNFLQFSLLPAFLDISPLGSRGRGSFTHLGSASYYYTLSDSLRVSVYVSLQ